MLTGRRIRPAPLLTAAVLLAACRRDEPAQPFVPSHERAPSTQAIAVAPTFENTPEGAARRFLYAWVAGDDAMLRDAIEPDDRYKVLFAAPWVERSERDAVLARLPSESVHQFKPGDQFPVGLPGRPKTLTTVPAGALDDENVKLVLIMERGLFVRRGDDGRWRVVAEPIIEEIGRLLAEDATQSARTITLPNTGIQVVVEPSPATRPASAE